MLIANPSNEVQSFVLKSQFQRLKKESRETDRHEKDVCRQGVLRDRETLV